MRSQSLWITLTLLNLAPSALAAGPCPRPDSGMPLPQMDLTPISESLPSLAQAVALKPRPSARPHQVIRTRPLVPAAGQTPEEALPAFCEDWHRKLEARTVDFRQELRDHPDARQGENDNYWWTTGPGGLRIGYYRGYSPISTCVVHWRGSFPVGVVKYSEIIYSITGATPTEALAQAPVPAPRPAYETTELFQWDRKGWSY